MSQHDFSIANQGFPSFRSDLNDALQALVSNSSGATAPTTTYAHQMWVDTTADPSILKIRNADNDAWITLGNIDQTGDTFIYTPAAGSASAPAYSTSGDLNTGVFFPGADIVALAAGGAEKLMASTSEVVVNDGSADVDFRVESDADTHALFVEGSSGNVGIGTSSPATKLHVYQSNASIPAIQLQHGDGDFILCEETGGTDLFKFSRSAGTNDLDINVINSASLRLSTNNTERARIDSSGNLLVGGTSTASVGKAVYIRGDGATSAYLQIGSTASSSDAAYFYNSNGLVGSITTSGSSTSYNTSSDYRLKENVVGVTGASARVQQLNPVRFNFISDPDKTVDGFLAHEVQDVVPEAITGTKDATAMVDIQDEDGNVTGQEERPVYQGIDQSKLVPLLTAALQEALTKIETLEARVAALEAA